MSLPCRVPPFVPLSGSTALLCSDPAVCSGAPASPFGVGVKPLPRVVFWFGFLNFSLLLNSVLLSLTSSGFMRRPRVKGFCGTELLVGPWLCPPCAIRSRLLTVVALSSSLSLCGCALCSVGSAPSFLLWLSPPAFQRWRLW